MAHGTPLIPFELKEAGGDMVSSTTLSEAKLVLLVFTCNHCPYAIASWPVLIDLQKRYGDRGLQIVGINPNNNPAYPDDRFDAMQPYKQQTGINFPYLFDADQSVARAYKAVCTPDPFLFVDGKLAYHGRLTDNWQKPEAVNEKSIELQIQAALGEGGAPAQTYPSM